MTGGKRMFACVREKNARIACPGHCACIDVRGDREPVRFLHAALTSTGPTAQRLTWATKVDFCARDLPVVTLAAFLDRALPNQVFVPAGKVYAVVSRQIDGATMAEVAAAVGLMASERQ